MLVDAWMMSNSSYNNNNTLKRGIHKYTLNFKFDPFISS